MDDEQFLPAWMCPPGETIRLIMLRRSLSPAGLAEAMNCEHALVESLLCGQVAIDAGVADRLAACIGGTAAFWTARQRQFDAALDRLVDLVPAEVGREWLRTLPTKALAEANWIERPSHLRGAVRGCLAFFDVASPDEWKSRYTSFANQFSFRTSPSYESKIGALSVWLRQGELRASCIPVKQWDKERFRRQLSAIRSLVRVKDPRYFIPRLRGLCAEVGVAVAFVQAPVGCRASGAARFISESKALIVLSFRHKSDDHFWFTFFHEAGHLVLHQDTFVDEDGQDQSSFEAEANTFSAGVLIPAERRDELLNLPARSKSVIRFAVAIGVSPGVVVGQMQHLKLIGPHQLNHLKRRFDTDSIFSMMA